MGIISEYRKENRKHSNYKEPVRKETGNLHSKILDLSYMNKMIDNVMKHHITPVPKKEYEGFRTWNYVQNFRLKNILGYVDTPTWVYMLEGLIEFAKESRQSIQPNGQWELCNYEYSVEVVENKRNRMTGKDADGRPMTTEITEDVQYLVIGIKFVDIRGQDDVQYDMGRPRRQSENQLSPKMLKELLANQAGQSVIQQTPGITDEYKQLVSAQQDKIAQQDRDLEAMRTQMSTMQEMMAGLITELQTSNSASTIEAEEPSPAPKVVKRNAKKK